MSVAVLVNLRARRGSESLGAAVRSLLPDARLVVTRTLDDARRWIRDEIAPRPPTLLLSGGGDGTAVSLLNELLGSGVPLPAIGLLPLGTGNGWARETRAPKARAALQKIAALGAELPPLRRFALVEVEGRVTPFAGTGWDAEIVQDYHDQLAAVPASLRDAQNPMVGYLRSLFTRTIPRHIVGWKQPIVRLTNLGDDALVIDPAGRAIPVPGGGAGAVLYEGPVSVFGAGTTTELGLGFRAFPFAHAVPGRVAVRVYAASTAQATRNIVKLWRGHHPLPLDHHWLLTRWRLDFDRPVPFEIGGDVDGERTSVEMSLARPTVDLVDWQKLAA